MDLRAILPDLAWVRSYQRGYLRKDIVAGIVLTAILVPAGMGYAEASGLPPIVGLYASIVPLLAYAVLGPSRILVLGPDSALLPIIAAAIVPLAAGDEARAVTLAALLAVIVGVIVIAAGIARLGFLTALLSAPVRVGYLNGIALLVDRRPAAQAVRVQRGCGRPRSTRRESFATGRARRRDDPGRAGHRRRLAGRSSSASGALRAERARASSSRSSARRSCPPSSTCRRVSGVPVVGPLPSGLPPVTVPSIQPGDIIALLPAALGIALVSATDMSVLSRTLSIRRGEEVSQDRELIALGGANLATGFLSGMPVSSSASRTPVAEAAGRADAAHRGRRGAPASACCSSRRPASWPTSRRARSPPWSSPPALSLVDVGAIVRLWRMRSTEVWLALATFAGVALIGVIEGVFLAVGLSLVRFIQRAWWPHDAVLGRADGVKGYHDVALLPGRPPGPRPPALPLRCAAVLRQRRGLPRPGPRTDRRCRGARPLGGRRGRADHRRRHDRRRGARPGQGGARSARASRSRSPS